MTWVDEYISWDPRDFMGLEVGLQSDITEHTLREKNF